MTDGEGSGEYREFKALVEAADRKFARARDLPLYGGGDHHSRKAFKAYTRLWRLQQERRRELVAAGLRRWEIGEVASRIGQLYYARYLRTAEPRSLVGAYVFYEAIYSRGYFAASAAGGGGAGSGGKHQGLLIRYKELRFIARFLVVAMLMRRAEAVDHLVGRLRSLLDETKSAYPKTNFKEWKQVLQELGRFLKADGAYKGARSLRYDNLFDSYASNLASIARFHSKRVLKLKEAVLTSYRRNEVKFTELTLDTFRMLQCLEWEPTGSYQIAVKELTENGTMSDQSGPSGLIDIHLSTEISDGSLPSNPQKAILYHPSVSHLLAVLATICDELSQDSILLIYISASGSADQNPCQKYASSSSSRAKPTAAFCTDKPNPHTASDNHLWLGPRGSGGPNILYPEDLIPFTRYPLFLVIDSENSHAFKAIHNAEKGEPAALLLSPRIVPAMPGADSMGNGSQFTYFLTAPMQAFCQLAGITSDIDSDTYANAENILFSAMEQYEETLCTSVGLNNVWGQILPDPFLRRLILRFIFCRAVLFYFHPEEHVEHLPTCLPSLPESVSPKAKAIKTPILLLAENLVVSNRFHFGNKA
ncbi:protein SCAI homolog isoform X1 [Brachypodium distachyon]|nr:protein SCAI homolog isoform X1 [Brachypodium distachyon]|eukprot:XP_003578272.3 protein SCAI homolog isoform X1 [Brachypodium distachyon]